MRSYEPRSLTGSDLKLRGAGLAEDTRRRLL